MIEHSQMWLCVNEVHVKKIMCISGGALTVLSPTSHSYLKQEVKEIMWLGLRFSAHFLQIFWTL